MATFREHGSGSEMEHVPTLNLVGVCTLCTACWTRRRSHSISIRSAYRFLVRRNSYYISHRFQKMRPLHRPSFCMDSKSSTNSTLISDRRSFFWRNTCTQCPRSSLYHWMRWQFAPQTDTERIRPMRMVAG